MKSSHLAAVAIVGIAAAWIASGQLSERSEAQEPAVAAPAAEAMPTVRARVLVAEPRAGQIVLRGRTEALRTVVLRSETEGRVVDLPVAKGARVTEGQVICRLATEDRAAGVARAQATLRQRELEHQAAIQLSAKGFTSQTRAAEAAALLDGAKADLSRTKVELARAEIRAPFDGVVEARPAEIGDLLLTGDECATVVDADPILVVGQAAERDVGLLSVGQKGSARLADGRAVEGALRFIAQTAQETTRTFRVELEAPNPDDAVKSGLSAEIAIPTPPILAHLVSPAVLTLDDAGVVGVRTVDAEGRVAFNPVTPVASTAEGMWIAGLPERATVITVGQEFVRSGQTVKVTLEAPQS